MPIALQYLSLQCIFCSLAEQEATVLVKARCVQCWVTLAPTTSHPTANVVSQGKAPSLPKSVQIWLIGRDISQNSKNSSLNPRPFFIWMLLVASNRKNIYSMGMYLLCRALVKSESFEVRICQFQCGHELAVSASVTLNQSE